MFNGLFLDIVSNNSVIKKSSESWLNKLSIFLLMYGYDDMLG